MLVALVALCSSFVYAGGSWSTCTRVSSQGTWIQYAGGAECGAFWLGWGNGGADRCRWTTASANLPRDAYLTYRHLFQKRATGDTNALHWSYAEGSYSANQTFNQQGSGNSEVSVGARASYNWDDWLEVGSDWGATMDTIAEKAKFYPELEAIYSSKSVVTSMYMGNVYQWMYKMDNPAHAWWSWNTANDSFYHTGGVVEGPGWYAANKVNSAPGTDPGGTMTVNFNMRPTQTGSSNEDFQMLRNGTSWFGDKAANNANMRTAVNVSRKAPGATDGVDSGAKKKGETVRFSIFGADSWGTGNSYGWDFDGTTTQGWTAINNCTLTQEGSNGRIKIAVSGTDPHCNSSGGLAINTDNCKYMSIRMMTNGGSDAQFFWQGSAGGWHGDRHVDWNVVPDGRWHVYTVKLPASWTGTVTQVRLDPVGTGAANGQTVYVDWLRVHNANQGMSANVWLGVENEEWNIAESQAMTWDATNSCWYKDFTITGNYPQTYYNMMHVLNNASQQCDNDDDRRYGRYQRAYKMLNTAPVVANNSFPDNGWCTTKTPELGWDYSDADNNAQSRFSVQVASDSGFNNVVAETDLVASAANSFIAPTLPEGQLYYRTRVMDGAYSNLEATYNGGCTLNSLGALSGDSNKGVELDGASGYVALPSGFDSFGGGFTFEWWAYPTEARSWARFLDLGNGPSSDNIVITRKSTTNDLSLDIYQGSTSRGNLVAPGAISLNTWQYFVVTIDTKGYARIYKDGTQIAQGPVTLPEVVARSNGYIGKSNWAADAYYKGRLDEVAIYDRCLSAAEVTSHFNKSAANAPAYRDAVCASGPWAYYRFDEATGTSAAGITGMLSNWSAGAGFRIDSIAPTAPSISGIDITGSTAAVSFDGSSDDNDFSYEIKLDDGSFEAAVSPFEFASLAGTHTVYVRAIDEAGNVSEVAEQEFAMDNTAPTIDSVTSLAATNSSPIQVDYTVSDSESGVKLVTLWAKQGAAGTWAATNETSASANGSFNYAVSDEDTYYFDVVAEDNAGNVSDEPSGDGATSTIYDITPPSVTIGVPSVSDTAAGPVTYEITIDGADQVTLADEDITLNKTNTANAGSVAASGTELTTRTVTISDISGIGVLGISIAAGIATDAAGNTSLAAGPSATFNVFNHIASYGISNKAAWDSIIGIASSNMLFTVWGKVTGTVEDDSFTVDDGSGMPVKVVFEAHGFSAGDYVSATGSLDVSGVAPELNAMAVKKQN